MGYAFLLGELPPKSNKHLILIPKGWTREHSGKKRNAWNWFKENYPAIANHLQQYAGKAETRYDQGEYWWELRACDYYTEFEKPKIILPDISVAGNFTLDEKGNYYSANTSYIICTGDKYLLGILNSTLMNFYYKNTFATYRGGYLRFFTQYVEQLPVFTINFNNSQEKAKYEKLVSFVERILELHKKRISLLPSAKKEKVEGEIAITDEKIDEIVYELYGVTDEERKIIEGNNY